MADLGRWFAPRPLQLLCLAVALTGSIGLLVAGWTIPVYQGVESDSTGAATSHSETLVAANGAGVMVVLAVPLAVTLLDAAVLLTSTQTWALVATGVLTGVLALLNVLAMLTIGIFVLPVTAALAVAWWCGLQIRLSTTSEDRGARV